MTSVFGQEESVPLPLVTILTPTYNQAAFIEETIRSVLAQTYPNIEYVIIDDGSTDGTPDIVARYSDVATCIRQENIGQAATINKGIELASGEYFGYLSSDDLLHPEAVSRLVSVMRGQADTACVFPDADLIDASSAVVKRNVCREFDYEQLLIQQECYIGPGAIFRTDYARRLGGWRLNLRLAPDREFWLRLCKLGSMRFVPEVLAGYRLHRASISYSEVSESVSQEYIDVLDRHFADLPAQDPAWLRRDEAYGHANFLIARNCLRAGSIRKAWAYYVAAVRLHRPLMGPSAWIALIRTTLSKPVRIFLQKAGAALNLRTVQT